LTPSDLKTCIQCLDNGTNGKKIPSFSGVISLLRYKYKIEMFSASMLPPAKRQRVLDRGYERLLFMGED